MPRSGGRDVTVTFVPAADCSQRRIEIHGVETPIGGDSYTFLGLDADRTLALGFRAGVPPTFTVTPSLTGRGRILPAALLELLLP